MILRVSLIIVAAVLLAAHFLRSGNLVVMGLCLLAPLLFFIRQRWSMLLLQLFAYLGAAIWLYTMIGLIAERIMMGQSWGGVVAILGTVTLITVLAGALLNSPAITHRYPPVDD